MFAFRGTNAKPADRDTLQALDSALAVIEFKPDGTILSANSNFLDLLGYSRQEIEGRHHRMFVDQDEVDSREYVDFWDNLRKGVRQSREFKRVGKGGKIVWIRAVYVPVCDAGGRAIKVVKFAADITEQKKGSLEDAGRIAAINRSQAVIEFALDGTILDANELFLAAMGYGLNEIRGKHHRMFVEPTYADSAEYQQFWQGLNRGDFSAGEYKRLAKGGREVWIMASYNPVLDETGKPVKVVKFATDVTQQKLEAADRKGQIEGISKSQAVIEFALDGTIKTANDNFLGVVGYSLAEIKGRHHRMFVDPKEVDSPAYREFWEALARGEHQSGEFRRVGRGGREVWIQASYTPILDLNGKPFKVVKYASDITKQVLARLRSEHVRQMMESVAAGAEELDASVQEIAEAMSKSRETAQSAVEHVVSAGGQAQQLDQAAQAMSSIVELIDNITGQINLLALNATIESARAGEAGRGFAVVAAEVKNLANQAKQATDKISREIETLNGIAGDVVGALGAIEKEIQQVNTFVTSTAAAVQQQSTVTGEMSASMQRAAAEAALLG